MVSVLAILGWSYRHYATEDVIERDVYTVSRNDLERTVTVSGSLQPQKYANISLDSTQLSLGEIETINVKVGDRVKKGDELLRLSARAARARSAAEALNASAQEEAEKLARRNWDKLKPEERSRLKILSAAARQRAAAAAVAAEKAILRSPLDGMVSELNVVVGEAPKPGVILRIIDPDSLQIEALVSESDVLRMRPGTVGRATFDALPPEEKFIVKLDRIDPEATTVSDVVYYRAYFNLPKSDTKWRVGLSADIDIVSDRRENVLAVPARLIKSDSQGKYVTVLIDEQSGRTERRAIVTGLIDDAALVEIVSGLREGEKILDIAD